MVAGAGYNGVKPIISLQRENPRIIRFRVIIVGVGVVVCDHPRLVIERHETGADNGIAPSIKDDWMIYAPAFRLVVIRPQPHRRAREDHIRAERILQMPLVREAADDRSMVFDFAV